MTTTDSSQEPASQSRPGGGSQDSIDSLDAELHHLQYSYQQFPDVSNRMRVRKEVKAAILAWHNTQLKAAIPAKLPPSDPKWHNQEHKPEPFVDTCDDPENCEHYTTPYKSERIQQTYNDGWNDAIDDLLANLKEGTEL